MEKLKSKIIDRFPITVKLLRDNKNLFCFVPPKHGKEPPWTKLLDWFKIETISDEDWDFASNTLLKFLPAAFSIADNGFSLDGALAHAFTQLAAELKAQGRATVPVPERWDYVPVDVRLAWCIFDHFSKTEGDNPLTDTRPFYAQLKQLAQEAKKRGATQEQLEKAFQRIQKEIAKFEIQRSHFAYLTKPSMQ